MSRTCLCRTYRSVTRIAEENGMPGHPLVNDISMAGAEATRVETEKFWAQNGF